MSTGLKKTLEFLAKTENEAAVQVLLAALDSDDTQIQEGALRALLDRRSVVGGREVLRRLHTIDDRWKAILSEKPGRLSRALRDGVLGKDEQACRNACQAACWFQEYDVVPTLINAMEAEGNPLADLPAKTMIELCGMLYEELTGPRDYKNRRDPQLVRKNLIGCLEKSVLRYPRHQRKEVIEAFLTLANRGNSTLKQILLTPHHPCYLALSEVLTKSPCAGVHRLLLSCLEDAHPPSAAITILTRRSDLSFVRRLLKKIGFEPSAAAAHNLQNVDSIPWLTPESGLMEKLNDAEQHSAVMLLMASKINRLEAYRTIEHLLDNGHPIGRRAAIDAMAEFKGADANQLALQCTSDEDPFVQAGAIGQLRNRGIPGALPKLIKLVDSPHEVVRQAVRESLTEFRFKRYLATFEMLEDDVRRSTGALVLKIDPETLPTLREELCAKTRTRRLRALEVASVLDAVESVEPLVVQLLKDSDHMVRIEAARALMASDSPAAAAALTDALTDHSVPVQETAQRSLIEISRRVAQRPASGPLTEKADS